MPLHGLVLSIGLDYAVKKYEVLYTSMRLCSAKLGAGSLALAFSVLDPPSSLPHVCGIFLGYGRNTLSYTQRALPHAYHFLLTLVNTLAAV